MLAQISFGSGRSQGKPLHLRVCVYTCLFFADVTAGMAAGHSAGYVGMRLCSSSLPWLRGHSLSPAPRGASQPQASGGQSRRLKHGSESALSLQTPPASAVQWKWGGERVGWFSSSQLIIHYRLLAWIHPAAATSWQRHVFISHIKCCIKMHP